MKLLSRLCIPILGLLLSQVVSGCAQKTPEMPSNSTLPNVTLPGSQVRQIKSAETGRNYDIYILLPEKYDPNRTKGYPVLYLLDGHWDFRLLDSIYGGLYYDGFVPEMIIVSITYSGANPDYESLRARDYTPIHYSAIPGSGGAPKFLAFLKKELFPLIEANYRTDTSRRVLMGHSFGGAFTLYAMFSEPELFSGYVAASPAVVFANSSSGPVLDLILDQEAEYASTHKDLPARLFISVGSEEALSYPVQEFMKTIRGRNYPGLELETRIIEGERHAGTKPESFNRGLRYIFQGK